MGALLSSGLDEQTIERMGLGLREPYLRADGETVSGVLVYPTPAANGRIRFGCINLAGVTEHPEHAVGWSAGRAEAVSYGSGTIALVCASAHEAWLAWQAADLAGVALTAMASTQPDRLPDAWSGPRQWAGWTRVVVTDATSRALVAVLAAGCGRPLERCPSTPSAEGGKTVGAEELADWIGAVLEGEVKMPVEVQAVDLLLPGDFAASRVPMHGGLHDGRMYYAFAVERRERADAGFVFSYRTLVVRSDGAILEPGLLPAPPNTPAERRVHALSDGTRIAAGLGVPANGSWSLPSIKRFVARMQAGRGYDGPAGEELLARLVAHLRSVVWLPDERAYGMVASFVMATFFYRLFDAFPLLYVNGPKGSGKSELTTTVVSAAFNGSLMAQGSAAALVRLAGDSGGLVAIDDAEALTAGFGELAQVLKVGYKSSTGLKRMVGAAGSVETIDFYGPRVLCNTRGLDDVLLSRCLVVATEPLPAEVRLDGWNGTDVGAWRDDMHCFAMSYVREMAVIAARRRAAVAGRDDELTLPLHAVAELIGSR